MTDPITWTDEHGARWVLTRTEPRYLNPDDVALPADLARLDPAVMAAAGWVKEDAGKALYHSLCHGLIERILAADAKCDPPLDVDLRLASIIMERDALRARAEAAERENARLRGALGNHSCGVGEHVVWLIERTIDGRPHWMAWRGRDRCEWVADAAQADQFADGTTAGREARTVAASQQVECRATEHMFVSPPPAGEAGPAHTREALARALAQAESEWHRRIGLERTALAPFHEFLADAVLAKLGAQGGA